jgi:hypothetical protein
VSALLDLLWIILLIALSMGGAIIVYRGRKKGE